MNLTVSPDAYGRPPLRLPSRGESFARGIVRCCVKGGCASLGYASNVGGDWGESKGLLGISGFLFSHWNGS